MAEVKNSFLKSKMNKDLDSRLLPNGEYRDAVNVQVIKSEGDDVGALENVLGNQVVGNFAQYIEDNIQGVELNGDLISVGYFVDQTNSDVYLFFTDYPNYKVDTKYKPEANNFIVRWSSPGSNQEDISVLAYGAFLNFHPSFPIIGVNLLEQLLFFTDNRNQPRKINVTTATTVANYYTTEDQISVAKYNPYRAIEIYKTLDVSPPPAALPTLTVAEDVFDSLSFKTTSVPPVAITPGLTISSSSYIENELDQVVVSNVDYAESVITLNQKVSLDAGSVIQFNYLQTSMVDAVSPNLPDGSTSNPFHEPNYAGDPKYLEDKFVKFSYRFRFDDGEYSILAPFTQACFIPKQDGYFLDGDEEQTFSSTIVDFAKNKVNKIDLQVPLPDMATKMYDSYKISEIDIIYKESDALAVQVIETIPLRRIQDESKNSKYFKFTYLSTKPYKTLPESELVRVYDKTPVKAFSQEVSSNRIIYGNFQDKHTPPAGINYQVSVSRKLDIDGLGSNLGILEYPSSTVKENRNYQVGVVLSDKFGRQSTVILSNNQTQASAQGFKADTVYLPYGGRDVSDDEYPWNFLGNSLKVQFNEAIRGESFASTTGEPGIYNDDVTSEDYNPLGWYSYKIVVKQVEQDYYNVYSAGAMKGLPYNYDTNNVTPVLSQNTSFITLLNDNINKVPRDLTEVGPQDKAFRSSVKLFGRVMNTDSNYSIVGNEQFSAANLGSPGRSEFTTNTIEDLYDLFDVLDFENNVDSKLPITSNLNPFHAFYKSDSNPFIAEFITSQNSDFQFGANNQSTTTNVGSAVTVNPSSNGDIVLNIGSLTSGFAPTPGELVTGGAILAETFVVSYDASSGDLTLSKAQPAIQNNITLTFSDVTYDDIENLAILETSPTVSRIDIFWETTSSGLISDLNTAIEEGIGGATQIDGFDFYLPESLEPNESVINNANGFFTFRNENGDDIAPDKVNMLVFDLARNPVTNRFTLEQSGVGIYLRTNDYFYFEGPDRHELNEFKFEFTVETPGPVINKLEAKSTSSNPIRVTNVDPIINIPGDIGIAKSYTSNTILSLLENFNGSADPDRKRILKGWTISPITAPSSQDFKTEFRLSPAGRVYKDGYNKWSSVNIYQASKGRNSKVGQPNFGTYSYTLTAEDEGGGTTSVVITQDIGIPNMVDYMSLVQRQNFIQADGAVEFFVDELSNLDSTSVIPQNMQIGYTTSGLSYDNEIKGPVCESGDTNDSVYYARAYKSKPQGNPSSVFYVYTSLQQSDRLADQSERTSAGVYAAIEFRESSSDSWDLAQDVFGEDCIYANRTTNEVRSTGDVILSGMTSEDASDADLVNRLRILNITEPAVNTKESTQGFAAMLNVPAGRVFVLNQPGEYRVAWGNLFNSYNAFEADGVKCNQEPTIETNIKYEIGDFTNVDLNSFLRNFSTSPEGNVYEYQAEAWQPIPDGGASCGTGVFEPTLTYYSASPFARYLFAKNTTQIDTGLESDTTTYSEPDQIFGLFVDPLLTTPEQVLRRASDEYMYTRIRLAGSNPESTRDGTYLIRTFKNSMQILGPCLDASDNTSSSSGSGGKKGSPKNFT